MALVIVGLIAVGFVYLVIRNTDNLFEDIEEPVPPSAPPASVDPCIALALDLDAKRRADAEHEAAKADASQDITNLKRARGALRISLGIALGVALGLSWFPPGAVAAYAAAAVVAGALAKVDADLAKAEKRRKQLSDAEAGVKGVLAESSIGAIPTAPCRSPTKINQRSRMRINFRH